MKVYLIFLLVILVITLVIVIWGALTNWKFVEGNNDGYENIKIKKSYNNIITTIIITAPQPSIPSIKIIKKNIESLKLIPLFYHSKVIIGFDGGPVLNKKLHQKCTQVYRRD